MELAFGAAGAAFRDEVRTFLDEKLTPELRATGRRMGSMEAGDGSGRLIGDESFARKIAEAAA
ncbi:MAG: hypothetical protein H5U13_13440 [Parvibaculum sp.]|nr:hypothetical protein [Parvibaculum sp.]